MVSGFINLLGGIGMFLLGMLWLTEGLRGLSGQKLRDALTRFTRTPFTGVVTGTISTAVLQSSSATTVAAVGFVSAGLLTFPQALGIIFGANIGTTVTGWLVALLGYKLDLGTVTLPLVFVGALMRTFGEPRTAFAGTALSGFSLLFIGIEALKAGMTAFEGLVTPQVFPDDSFVGRLQLILIGIAITVVTQSSSAGVATALAALGAGAINLPQAAAMVIGMDVGTTFTAALATLGGSTATRRTGLSHVFYNVLTGLVAFSLLTPFTELVAPRLSGGDGQIALVAFHTGFNLLGVLLVLPFTGQFACLVEWLIPEEEQALTRHLGKALLVDADASVDAAAGTVGDIYSSVSRYLADRLSRSAASRKDASNLREIGAAISELQAFISKIPPRIGDERQAGRLASVLHALDHLDRLQVRCTQDERITALASDLRLKRLGKLLQNSASRVATSIDPTALECHLDRVRRIFRDQRSTFRARIIEDTARGRIGTEEAIRKLDALRWLHRSAYHLWRIQHHINLISGKAVLTSERVETAIEVLED